MKFKTVLVVCSVWLLCLSIFAQTPDPVSGVWGDPAGPGFDLKYDGRTLSGTIRITDGTARSTAPIKVGSFDPKTGALKLEGDSTKPDGTPYHFVIAGTIQNNTVKGTYTIDNNTGDFTFERTKR